MIRSLHLHYVHLLTNMRRSQPKRSGSPAIENSKLSKLLNLAMTSDYQRTSANVDYFRARIANDEHIDRANRIAFVHPIIKTFRQECRLLEILQTKPFIIPCDLAIRWN